MVDTPRRGTALRLATAFVIGFVSLTLEIAYTRVISFKIFYYYTYFVIGLALLGLGAAGAFIALSDRLRAQGPLRLVRRVAPIAGAVGVGGYVLVARLPLDVNLIWAGSASQAARQVGLLLLLSISLTTVFFAAGLLFSALVVDQAGEIRRLYFWDLSGAALGCLVAVPLQALIGPPAMILASSVLLAALGFAVAMSAGEQRAFNAVALGFVALIAIGGGQLRVRADESKTQRDSDVIEAGEWGAVFRVAAVDLGDLKVLHHDGLWGSSIWRYDGTRATTARFDVDNRQVPFAATPDDPKVLIIGAAGGNEIMASLTYGAGEVDAVELNPVTVDLLEHTYYDYTGGIVDDPRVDYVQGDGRTFLARSDDEYDLVWFVAPDSYAASNAATSGAFVLSESYLYTQEMIETAFDHLSDDGIVVAQFGDFDFDTRPNRSARYLVTARAALDGRVDEFADHIGVVVERGESNLMRTSTILLFRQPPESGEVDAIHEAIARVPDLAASYLPGDVHEEGVTTDIILGTDAEVDSIVDQYPYEIGTITDNRPFFWHFSSFRDVLTNWDRGIEGHYEIAIGERLLLLLVAIAAIVAAAFLWLPFGLTRRRNGARAPIEGRWRLFVYFATIGLGFMLIEISMIQRFSLLLGFPTLSLTVSLFTLLIATAIGARASSWVKRTRHGVVIAVALLAAVCLLYMRVVEPITDHALAWEQWARILVVVAMLFPIGLLLGVFLPNGMDAAVAAGGGDEVTQGRLVAWCWAVNGFFSVLGSSLTTIISMTYGFNVAVAVGLALYAIATACSLRGTQRSEFVDAESSEGRVAALLADGA